MAKNPFLGKFQIQVQTGILVRIHMISHGGVTSEDFWSELGFGNSTRKLRQK